MRSSGIRSDVQQYPAEIFPLEIRAKGNAWGVVSSSRICTV